MAEPVESELEHVRNMILLLLNADNKSPIYGKTILIKQVFVMAKEIATEIDDPLRFYPFQIGPYSTVLAKLLNQMIRDNLIDAESVGNTWTFTITTKGEKLAEDERKRVSEDQLLQIDKLKRVTSEWGLNGTLRYVYENYPEYAIDTRLDEVLFNS